MKIQFQIKIIYGKHNYTKSTNMYPKFELESYEKKKRTNNTEQKIK